MTKIHKSLTISKDLIEWIDEQIECKRFKDFSHAIEYAVYELRKRERKQKE
jgi:Arc/MetJ-type ribon-helix-helix transcriptional regulator